MFKLLKEKIKKYIDKPRLKTFLISIDYATTDPYWFKVLVLITIIIFYIIFFSIIFGVF